VWYCAVLYFVIFRAIIRENKDPLRKGNRRNKKMAKQNENKKKSFVLYVDFFEALECLNMTERGMLFTMIYSYAITGKPGISGCSSNVKLAFSVVRAQLDRDLEKYENIRKRNTENGKKGGRPRKDAEVKENPKKPKKADNDNDNENDNENDNDSDNGSGNDNEYELFAPLTTTPSLTEKEKEKLISEGVPPEYIEYVSDRVSYYAHISGCSAVSLLRKWWDTDKANPKWKSKPQGRASPVETKNGVPYNAYVEEWFEARLKQAFGE
jgi:hypothetical protein